MKSAYTHQNEVKKILFVCLGNICRSPLAEGIAQKLIKDKGLNLYAESAGTSNWHKGEAPCNHSIKVAKNHGIDISTQKSRPVSQKDIISFDLIIAMDTQNKLDLENMGFRNIYLLGDYGGFEGANVPDPYYFPGFEGFEKIYAMIDTCINDLIAQLSKKTRL